MSQPTILVVEDNATTRKEVRVALTAEGYAVLEAPDGRTALELMARAAPDLVLQDLLLPDMDGFDLVGQLRALPGSADLPIIALSGFLSGVESSQALTLGFTDFLVKPVESSRLAEVVRNYVGSTSVEPSRQAIGRRILLVDDDPIGLKLSRTHLRQCGFTVITASDGAEALEIALLSPPDAILSDVLMPRLDGFQLCAAVREDARLAHVPVILCSANYVEESDRRLAERSGASAMVVRTPGLEEAIRAVVASLEGDVSPAPEGTSDALEVERLHRVVRQLERQVSMNAGLIQRVSLQAALLSLVTGLSDSVGGAVDIEAAPGEALAGVLHVGGVSVGALYLRDAAGHLRLHVQLGVGEVRSGDPAQFFGHVELFELALGSEHGLAIPSIAVSPEAGRDFLARLAVGSAVLVTLTSRGDRLGILLLASQRRDLTHPDWLAFARSLGAQLGQTIALSRSFTRLSASERRYRHLFDSTPIGLCRTTSEGQFLEANPALISLLGCPDLATLFASRVDDYYFDPEDRRRLLAVAEREGTVLGHEMRFRRRDGMVIWGRMNVRALREGDNIVYEGSIEDVTARRLAHAEVARQREALMQTEKLAAMGQLLAGVAHELNNPLCVVLGQAALLRSQLKGGPLDERAVKITTAADRCARIIRNFLALARQRPAQRERADINVIVREAVELLVFPLRVDSIEVALDLGAGIPPFSADANQLHQVLVNLVTNAHHALRQQPPPRRITITTRADAQRGVVLTVADNGPGIPPESRTRIFEPFFTTKEVGKGTGLGLSLCQGIVEAHGGVLTLNDAAAGGAEFRVELPVAPPPVHKVATASGEETPITGKRILVVDDEEEVAAVLVELLSIDRHEVDTAKNGTLALERIRRQRYDLVVSDLRMPELDGPGLYRAVEAMHPDLARTFVFITGDNLGGAVREFLDRAGRPTLTKPFEIDEILRVIRGALRAADGP